MAKPRKRAGRVTPKGTKDPNDKKRPGKPAPPKPRITHQRDLPGQVRRPQAFGGRPESRHRGNR